MGLKQHGNDRWYDFLQTDERYNAYAEGLHHTVGRIKTNKQTTSRHVAKLLKTKHKERTSKPTTVGMKRHMRQQ